MQFVKESPITRLLVMALGFMIFVYVLFGIATLYGVRTVSGLTRTIYNHPLVVSNASLQSNVAITKMHRDMKDVVLFNAPDKIERSIALVNQQEQNVYQYLDVVSQNILGDQGKRLVREAKNLFDDWRPIRQEVIQLVRAGQREAAAAITVGKGATHVRQLEEKMIGLTQYARNKASSFMAKADSIQTRITAITLLFLASGALLSLVVAFLAFRKTASAETELRDSHQLLVNAIDVAPIGMVLMDPHGAYHKVNPVFCQMTGYTEGELTAMRYLDITPSNDYDIGTDVIQTLLRGEKPWANFEKRYTRKDGHPIDVLVTTSLIKNNVDEPVYFFSQIQDITEKKRAEEALKNSEEKYRMLFKSSSDAILLWDIDTFEILDANQKAIELYGYTHHELLSLKASALAAKPDDIQQVRQASTDTAIPFQYHRKMDGTLFPVEITSNAFTLNLRNINICAIRDITEIQKIEKRLDQAQRMEAIGTLAGGIAHDFNNILSSIIGFTELALDDVAKDSTMEDNLHEVYLAGKRAKDLVRQILAFARQAEEDVKPIQVNLIAKEVLKLIRSSIPATIDIEQQTLSDSLIMGSSTQIHQVFMNLCTNAAQAMENEGGTLGVTIDDVTITKNHTMIQEGLTAGDYLVIRVSDTGVGMPPEVTESIFEPYYSTKSAGEGTGLGLSVVHGIVESNGGKIDVISEVGKGSQFIIYLPVTKKRTRDSGYQSETLPTGGERILLVDDEAPIAKIGAQILQRLGYDVTTRTSSIEALHLFRSKPQDFDLVITDITMPNMTGDALARELLNIREDLPVIACTGYSKKISKDDARRIGIKALAYKPIIKAELAITVRHVLDQARAVQENQMSN